MAIILFAEQGPRVGEAASSGVSVSANIDFLD